jgi:excisionase family DNA binding protein
MLLTIPEACASIRVGRTKFYQLLNAGEIKAVKIGKKTLIPEKSILQWIEDLPSYKPANNNRTK